MSTFNQKERIAVTKLIAEINADETAKEKLLEIVKKAFTERSKSITTPADFLSLLLSPTAFETSSIKLESLQRKYILSVFKDSYSGEKEFKKLSEVTEESETDKEVRNTLRDATGLFNSKEKIALKQHSTAVNKINPLEKIKALTDALKECSIGGHTALIILRDIAKILIGKTVGKTKEDAEKDAKNTKNQKKNKVQMV